MYLRIKDPNSSRSALIGIGFRERETAFDFKNALNEYVRYVGRLSLAEEMASARVRWRYLYICLFISKHFHFRGTLNITIA